MTESPNIPFEVEASRLADFLACADTNSQVWDDSELEGVLEHQWRASVSGTLGRPDLPPGTFGDLFTDGEPSLSVLKAVHEYAKHAGMAPDSHLPPDVARLLYLAAIFAARSRCDAAISRMPDTELQRAAAWVRSRSWLTPEVRRVLGAILSQEK